MADRKRILIVDDDYDLVGLLKTDLQHFGYETVGATNGREALEIAKSGKFDLLLLDIMLPESTGYSVAKAIGSSGNPAPPKIIIMTCLDIRRESGLAMLSGVTAMVQKPFTMEALHRKIADVLDNR
jgi:DNA-binding response OmpR family regulator